MIFEDSVEKMGAARAEWREQFLQDELERHGVAFPVSPEMLTRLLVDFTLVEKHINGNVTEVWVEFRGDRCSAVMVETFEPNGSTTFKLTVTVTEKAETQKDLERL